MSTAQNGFTQTTTSTVANTGVNYIDSLLGGDKWGAGLGAGVALTYSFPWTTSGTASWASNPQYTTLNEASSADALNSVEQASARVALACWAAVANVTFSELSETSSDVGDIRFAWTSETQAGSVAWAYYPDSYWASGGDVWLSQSGIGAEPDSYWQAGNYGLQLLIHELGHALGLKHPFEDSPVLPASVDTRQYSVMSYTESAHDSFVEYTSSAGSYSYSTYSICSDTPMLYDIAAIQYLYGANLGYRTGNDVYTFDPATPFFRTIWDAGGNDTISVANFTRGCVIDLQPGHYSKITIVSEAPVGVHWSTPPTSTYDGTDACAIAFGCDIENATGGGGDDTLLGNTLANMLGGGDGDDLLSGMAGADTLTGGNGSDSAVYTGRASEYSVRFDAAGGRYTVSDSVGGRDGADSLSGIESLRFSDVSGAIAGFASAGVPVSYALTPAAASVGEGGSLTYTLSSTGVASGTVLYYALSGVSAADVVGAALGGALTLGAAGGATFTVTLAADHLTEGSETLQARLTDAGAATLAGAAAVAVIDSSLNWPLVALAQSAFSVLEGNSGTRDVALELTLDHAVADSVTVHYSLRNGTAQTGTDVLGGGGSLTFEAGATSKTLNVSVAGDTLAEADEYLWVDFDQVSGGAFAGNASLLSARVNILDDDTDRSAPSVTAFSPADETTGVSRTANISITFNEAIQRGSGGIVLKNAADTVIETFDAATSGNLSIAGDSVTINPSLDLGDDTGYKVELAAGSIKDLAGNSYAGTTSYNFTTSPAPALSLSPAAPAGAEGNDGATLVSFTVLLSAAAAGVVTVGYATADVSALAGSDYNAASGTLSFAAGETSKTISVSILGDRLFEGDETFRVDLTGAAGAALDASASALATIANDDAVPVITVSPTLPSIAEGNDGAIPMGFTIRLSGASASPISVNYATVDGSALAGSDYSAVSGTLSFAAGETSQTFSVPLRGDLVIEDDETLFIHLSNAIGAVLGPDGGTDALATIANDDLDTISPSISAFYLDNQDNVPVRANLVFSFSEQVEPGAGQIVLKNAEGIVETYDAASANVDVSGGLVTVNPSADLAYGVQYQVELTNGAFIDMAGNASPGGAYHFTTQAATPVVIAGTSGDDILRAPPGGGHNDIDGGAGIDTLVYGGERGNYRIHQKDGVISVTDKSGVEGSGLLSGVEWLQFSDAAPLSLEYNDVVQALYVAYFGRAADISGLANFQAALATLEGPHDFAALDAAYGGNAAIQALVDNFSNSDESKALYSGDTRAFASAIYYNVLNRGPDQGGLDFWVDAIDHAGLSQGNAALSIMAGALSNTSEQGLIDGALVGNKLTAAANFTFSIDTAAAAAAYSGDAAAAAVRAMLSSVTSETDADAFQDAIDTTLAYLEIAQQPLFEAGLNEPAQRFVELVGVQDSTPA